MIKNDHVADDLKLLRTTLRIYYQAVGARHLYNQLEKLFYSSLMRQPNCTHYSFVSLIFFCNFLSSELSLNFSEST